MVLQTPTHPHPHTQHVKCQRFQPQELKIRNIFQASIFLRHCGFTSLHAQILSVPESLQLNVEWRLEKPKWRDRCYDVIEKHISEQR